MEDTCKSCKRDERIHELMAQLHDNLGKLNEDNAGHENYEECKKIAAELTEIGAVKVMRLYQDPAIPKIMNMLLEDARSGITVNPQQNK